MKIGDLVKHIDRDWPTCIGVGVVTELCDEPALHGDQKIVVFWPQTNTYTRGGTKYLEAV